MVEALAAKNSEIETLVSAMDALKNQAALNEGKLSSLQGDMESIMRNRELAETRMMQALREELATTERRAEEERSAHNATKMAAMERERELEHRAVDASTALVRIQRIADERTAKVADFEQKVALLEVDELIFNAICSFVFIYLNFIQRIDKQYSGRMYISESRAARYGSSCSQRTKEGSR
jgi:ATPase subunit of ABC transporter with duplicated ATPase domains